MKVLQNSVDYNIEYAHIYTDELFGKEQIKSVEIADGIIKALREKNCTYSSSVLIDEYNSKKPLLEVEEFLSALESFKMKPDYLMRESKLAEIKDFLLHEIPDKKRTYYLKYIKEKKVPCSLLIAIWHLLRLGVFEADEKVLSRLNGSNKPFAGKRLLTVLPRRYRSVEEAALNIIKSTKYAALTKEIKYIFF